MQGKQFLSGKEEKSVFSNAWTCFFIRMLCNFGSKSRFGYVLTDLTLKERFFPSKLKIFNGDSSNKIDGKTSP